MVAQNASQESGESPSAIMLRFISGFWVSRALYVLVKLGIPDLLQNQSKSAVELAEATHTHAPSLYRIMCILVSVGVMTRDENDRFALTDVGGTLRKDVPGSVRAWAVTQLDEEHYQAWGDVLHSVQTGETAFQHQFGMDVWQYRALHPDQSKLFDEAMSNLINVINQGILDSYDFSSLRQVVDVGGGNGSLLINLLKVNPNMNGVVFDSPHVAEGARVHIETTGLSDRCTVVGGNFFDTIPSGGDAYILSRVIHDWDDEHSVSILKNCRRVMSSENKLLLVERVIPVTIDSSAKSQSVMSSDFNMLVMVGGRERSEAAYKDLLEAAGFKLNRVIATKSVMSIIVATLQ
ncbi:MAG: methyltransferase [Anaerolineae bacterium]|nr:methyltransferase [Anaerolineae bacterium]